MTYTSDLELVPDMCPETQRSIDDGYNVADASGLSTWRCTTMCGRPFFQMKCDIYGGQYGDVKRMSVTKMQAQSRTKEELQPVFYHQVPPGLHLEATHSFNAVCVWDFRV